MSNKQKQKQKIIIKFRGIYFSFINCPEAFRPKTASYFMWVCMANLCINKTKRRVIRF